MAPTILGETENGTDEVTVTINNPVSLICEALAFPSPTVTWMKDGAPFELSRNVQLLPGDALGVGARGRERVTPAGEVTLAAAPPAGTHGLQILNAQQEDAGQYSCVVTNELGEAVKNYHVEVLGLWVPKATRCPPQPPGSPSPLGQRRQGSQGTLGLSHMDAHSPPSPFCPLPAFEMWDSWRGPGTHPQHPRFPVPFLSHLRPALPHS